MRLQTECFLSQWNQSSVSLESVRLQFLLHFPFASLYHIDFSRINLSHWKLYCIFAYHFLCPSGNIFCWKTHHFIRNNNSISAFSISSSRMKATDLFLIVRNKIHFYTFLVIWTREVNILVESNYPSRFILARIYFLLTLKWRNGECFPIFFL